MWRRTDKIFQHGCIYQYQTAPSVGVFRAIDKLRICIKYIFNKLKYSDIKSLGYQIFIKQHKNALEIQLTCILQLSDKTIVSADRETHLPTVTFGKTCVDYYKFSFK